MKALAIDPKYAPATRLGWISMYGDNDLAGAAEHFNRALALDPAEPACWATAPRCSSLSAAWTRRWRSTRPLSTAIP